MLIASKLGYAWPSPDRPVTKDQVVLFSAKTVSGRPVSKNMKEDFKKLSNFRPLYPTGPVPEISYAKARFPNARLSRAASGKLYSGSTGETLVQVLNKYEVMTPAEQLVAVNTQRGGKENEYWKGVPGIYAKLLMNLVKTEYIPNLSNDVKLLWVAVVQKFTTTEGKALFDRLLGSSESMKPPFTFFVAESPSRGNVNKFTWDENRSLDSDRDYCYALKILYLPDWDKSRAKIDLAVKGGDYETANGQIRRIMKSGRRPTPEQVMRLLDDGSAEFVKKLRDTYPPLRTAAKALLNYVTKPEESDSESEESVSEDDKEAGGVRGVKRSLEEEDYKPASAKSPLSTFDSSSEEDGDTLDAEERAALEAKVLAIRAKRVAAERAAAERAAAKEQAFFDEWQTARDTILNGYRKGKMTNATVVKILKRLRSPTLEEREDERFGKPKKMLEGFLRSRSEDRPEYIEARRHYGIK